MLSHIIYSLYKLTAYMKDIDMRNARTPNRLKKDNFDLDEYLRRVAEFDVKNGILNRSDYLSSQPVYINRKAELLNEMDKEKEN